MIKFNFPNFSFAVVRAGQGSGAARFIAMTAFEFLVLPDQNVAVNVMKCFYHPTTDEFKPPPSP